MFITTSRNSGFSSKKLCKTFAILFSDIKHIPRGNTILKKIFESSEYLGYSNLLLVSKKKEQLFLEVYRLTKDSYLLENKYKINIDLNHDLSIIKKLPKSEKPVFNDLFESKKIDNSLEIKKKKESYSFFIDKKDTGFFFEMILV